MHVHVHACVGNIHLHSSSFPAMQLDVRVSHPVYPVEEDEDSREERSRHDVHLQGVVALVLPPPTFQPTACLPLPNLRFVFRSGTFKFITFFLQRLEADSTLKFLHTQKR